MADILCLKGDAAFSAFRLQRLQARLVAAVSDIESVRADYWHVVAQKRALTADERAKLAALLEEQPAGSAERANCSWSRRASAPFRRGRRRRPTSPSTAIWNRPSSASSASSPFTSCCAATGR
jgi:hypothetical protein